MGCLLVHSLNIAYIVVPSNSPIQTSRTTGGELSSTYSSRTVKLSPDLQRKAFDFCVSRDSTRAGSGRHYSLTNVERGWLFNIRVGTMVDYRHLFVDIQLYSLPCFALQLGFFQGIDGAPSSMVKRYGGLQDGRNTWAFYNVEDTTAMISYPKLATFRTVGFTK